MGMLKIKYRIIEVPKLIESWSEQFYFSGEKSSKRLKIKKKREGILVRLISKFTSETDMLRASDMGAGYGGP